LASRQIGVTISIESVGVPGRSRRQACAIRRGEGGESSGPVAAIGAPS
jgi:hypothetical protein